MTAVGKVGLLPREMWGFYWVDFAAPQSNDFRPSRESGLVLGDVFYPLFPPPNKFRTKFDFLRRNSRLLSTDIESRTSCFLARLLNGC